MPLIIPDDDPPSGPDGPTFRVFLPEFVKRFIGWLARFLSRRRVR